MQKLPPVQYDLVTLTGGLDQVTPTLSLRPGVMRDSQNWECSITGGYTRIVGYERFSGLPNPSSASYVAMTVTLAGAISVGDIIVGGTSSATGVVVRADGGTLIVTKVVGAFEVGETLSVGGTPRATYVAAGSATRITPALNATYLALSANVYRDDIEAVPGSGPILGVAYLNSIVYAWRNNVGGTAAVIHKSSPTGWQAVPLGLELSFTAGQAAGIAEGDTVVGGTSGATGVVTRVVVESGTFAANDAAGRLIFASVTGTFSAAENLQVSASTRATCSGAQAAITLLPGGRVQVDVASFGGAAGKRIYGCDGVNRGFEFDGAVYVPIATGMADDAPQHVRVHQKHLFFAFGASVQNSAIGDPYRWSPIFGAGEISLHDEVTAFLSQPGDQTTAALAIYTQTGTYVLYGSSTEDFLLKQYTDATGAHAYSAQNLSQSYVFDARGVVSLRAAQEFGNFDSATLSLNIRPFVQQRRNLVSASSINREKSQYRIFFSDGSGLYVTIVNGKLVGSMPVVFPNPVLCACQGDAESGGEVSYFGSSNGFVYRLDAGTSFDGAAIDARGTLTWNSVKSPRTLKRFRKGSLEITGYSYAALSFGYSLAYGAIDSGDEEYETSSSAEYWDEFTWDDFYWDGRTLTPTEVEILGSGENIAIRLACSSAEYESFTVNSLIMHYTPRRGIR